MVVATLRRAVTLLRTNPRLVARRLALLARYPGQSARQLLWSHRQRSQAIAQEYQRWRATQATAPAAASKQATSPTAPLISVIMPVHNPDPAVLTATIESVLGQTYQHWQYCIADDASTLPEIRPLLARYAAADTRISVVYRPTAGHIAAASNSALKLATGEFIVLLDHDDLLAPDALSAIADTITEEPLVDLIYSDEDKVTIVGDHLAPFFKPAWSPTLLLSCNYVTHLAAARRELVEQIGGFRTETVGSQDHDLFLRLSEQARGIAHIPRMLYSWRMVPGSTATASAAKPYTVAAAKQALHDTLQRRQIPATLEPSHLNGLFITRHQPVPQPRVSLVVAGDRLAWRAILRESGITFCDLTYLVAAGQQPPALRAGDPPTLPTIADLTGEYIVWLASGERPAAGTLAALLGQLRNEQVGVVGAVTSRRGLILQSGIILGSNGQPRYAFAGLPLLPQANFYLNLKDLARETSAVALGGSALRREVWQELGGWQSDLPPALAQIDLALRAQADAGYATIVTPLAQFTRRTPLPALPNTADYRWRWHDYVDPFWNPNLDPDQPDGLPFRLPADRSPRIRYRGPRGAFVATPPATMQGEER